MVPGELRVKWVDKKIHGDNQKLTVGYKLGTQNWESRTFEGLYNILLILWSLFAWL